MLKELRESKGIPASFVAEKLGISRETLRSMEAGEVSPRLDWIPILSFLYGVTVEEIVKKYFKEKEEQRND